MYRQQLKRTPIMAKETNAKTRLLDAALSVVRIKGYEATTVDDLCAAAGVTKGAFFHHFKSKEELGVAAAGHWSQVTGALFEAASYHKHADAFDRVLGYLDLRKELLKGEVAEFTCLVGTMVQETFELSPAIRAACNESISNHAAKLEADIVEAMRERGIGGGWTAQSLALHTQAVLQGAFSLA
jgi:TetR/AcrR family transcriptional repressor of nem operon